MDGSELGATLRAHRKAAGRTIASVALDAGLSVPYIANLENGRGNPTLSALHRLAGALGTDLRIELHDPRPEPDPAADPPPDLTDTPRGRAVVRHLARARHAEPAGVRRQLHELYALLAATVGRDLEPRDLDRALDLLTLARLDRDPPPRTGPDGDDRHQ
jgi:transcriptional regulator with XRE-family HTH domain